MLSRLNIRESTTLCNYELLAFSCAYLSILIARNSAWLPNSFSSLPVVESAWLNFSLVLILFVWLLARGASLDSLGLVRPPGFITMTRWVIVIMLIDALVLGVATPVLVSIFGETQQSSRFENVP